MISGRFDGPVDVLERLAPAPRDRGCGERPASRHPDAVDVDGDRVAFGQFSDECTADNGPWDDSVVVVGGTRRRSPVGTQAVMHDVALAGRYLAWVAIARNATTSSSSTTSRPART